MKKRSFTLFMRSVIKMLIEEGRHGTAHIYQSTLNTFSSFVRREHIRFSELTPALLKHFEHFLIDRQLSWNTISTYMRVLRAVYNRALEQRLAVYIPHHFKGVYTGTETPVKRALQLSDMTYVLSAKLDGMTQSIQTAHALFSLLFLLRGMPFVDLIHLRKCDVHGNIITYRRHKTGRRLVVWLEPEAKTLIQHYMNKDSKSPYLFSVLGDMDDIYGEGYKKYQQALRTFNHNLSVLSRRLNLGIRLSSYAARHTWATLAYYRKYPLGLISNAMGHSSVKVTETYIKPFEEEELHLANRAIISCVMGRE